MKKRQVILVSLLSLALAGALLGCGGGGDSTENPTPTPSPSPTPTPVPGSNRQIVFTSEGASGAQADEEIFIMQADGTGRTRLTTNSLRDVDAALSPNGTQIAFVRRDASSRFQLMIMNADGTNERQLTAARTYLRAPRWHPNGSRIVYGASASSDEGIFTIRPDGTEETHLEAAGVGSLPDWSPDGTKITFASTRAGTGSDIYIVNADGSGLVRVTNTADHSEWSPRWSPDGTKLLADPNTTESVDDRIYVLNTDGSGRRAIGPENARRPSWSPDGTRVLFQAQGDLFTMNSDGSDIRNLTNSSVIESEPSW